MPEKKIDFGKLLTTGDIITIIIIISGFLISVFVDETAFKLIGVSLAILGIVRLVMFITHRVNIMIDSNKFRPKTPTQDYKYSEKQDRKAKHVVIEDYTLSSDKKVNEIEKPKHDFHKEIREDEGFRLINNEMSIIEKDDTAAFEKQNSIKNDEVLSEQAHMYNSSHDEDQIAFEFEEEISGIKIIPAEKLESNNLNKQIKENTMENEMFSNEDQINDPQQDNKSGIDNYKSKKIDIPISELMEVEPAFGLEPRKEFEYFLNRSLKIIRSITNTKSAVFMLVNSESKELIVEAYDSDIPGQIAVRKRIPFGNDVVSQIVENMKPEILTDINPNAELDLIPYYIQEVGACSFFGMPVFYNDAIVGVICADSDEINAYDTSVVGLFGQFAKLIAGLIKSYTDKYDLMQDSRTLEAVNKFRSMIEDNDLNLGNINEAVLQSVSGMFDNVIIGLIGFYQEINKWEISAVRNLNYPYDIQIGEIIDNERSLAGATLNRNMVSVATPLRINDIRFNSKEEKISEGYFVSVPIKSFSNTYGALFVQGINAGDITDYDIKILKTLASHAGSTVEQIHFSEILHKSALFDPSTGLLNTPAFMQRLNEEVMRSLDFAYPMTLCLIEIDRYRSFDPGKHSDRHEMILMHVIDIIHSKLRTYDLLGRADSNVFGVVLIDIDSKTAKIWAEKLRSDVAINVLKIGNDSFTVTISLGVAQLRKDESIEDVFANAKEMLRLSKLKTNTVTMFE